jgi:Cu/Ag efflux pump CusA
MGAATFVAIFIAMFVAMFVPIVAALILSGKQWRAAEDRARARRMAEHRMNARLLRLNI